MLTFQTSNKTFLTKLFTCKLYTLLHTKQLLVYSHINDLVISKGRFKHFKS